MPGTKDRAYREKSEARIREMEARIDTLRAKADSVKADAKIKYMEQVEKLEKKLAAFRERMQKLGEAGEEILDELRDDAEVAWVELKTIAQHLADKLK